MPYWKHDSAIVDEGAQLGEGTKVWHFCHVSAGARIGERSALGQNVFIGNDVNIGRNVRIQNNVSVYDAVTLEDDVFCGPSMVFTNVYNPRAAVPRKSEYRRTLVRQGAAMPSWAPAPWCRKMCRTSRWWSACRPGASAG
jgi:UDP-2-acetamido-3-amino-2,3-dideoxy-glucuronate N-acetyltransferase